MKEITNEELKNKVEELVDFLCEKEMSQEGFLRVASWQENHRNYDVLDLCKRIYGLFGYIGFNEEQIECFIVNNLNVFLKGKDEINKIAFVLKEVDAIDEIFNGGYFASKTTNYKRLFMRDFISKKSGRYERGKGIAPLVVHDRDAYERYNMKVAAYRALGQDIGCDEELEEFLDKVLMVNGEHITVEDYIDRSSKRFYIKYLRDTNFGKGSNEDGGIGSI